MVTIRRAADRGRTNIDWLDGRHTFSFGDFVDPKYHHFRTLRVLNDDRIAPAGGFPPHPHRDMEILTCVLDGALEHQDSMGHGSIIRPGEWQYMSAGTGVVHSEFNPSRTDPTHLLQIWILPEAKGQKPRYDQKRFEPKPGAWTTTASRDGRDGSLTIRQDAVVNSAHLTAGEAVSYSFDPGRGGWLQVATGAVSVNGLSLQAGDGLAVEGESTIEVRGVDAGQVLLFDLA